MPKREENCICFQLLRGVWNAERQPIFENYTSALWLFCALSCAQLLIIWSVCVVKTIAVVPILTAIGVSWRIFIFAQSCSFSDRKFSISALICGFLQSWAYKLVTIDRNKILHFSLLSLGSVRKSLKSDRDFPACAQRYWFRLSWRRKFLPTDHRKISSPFPITWYYWS